MDVALRNLNIDRRALDEAEGTFYNAACVQYICTYVCIYIQTYIHTYIHTYKIFVHTYIDIYNIYIYIYIHTYIHISYIHTCIHTRKQQHDIVCQAPHEEA